MMRTPDLTIDQQRALTEGHGCLQGDQYILFSLKTYREMMGLASDAELKASLAAIEAGLEDVEAGRTHDLESVAREFDDLYGN